MQDWKVLTDIAGSLTLTGALLAFIWMIISGKLKTDGHHREVVAQHEASEKRAWEMVARFTEAREQDNVVLEKLTENIRDLSNTVSALRSAIENQRPRR